MGLELVGRARLLKSTSRTADIEVKLSQGDLQVYEGTFTFVVLDHAGFVATSALCRMGAAAARKDGFERVADFGSPFAEPGAVAG